MSRRIRAKGTSENIAAVIVHHGGAHPGFVLGGRSLREVEKRVDDLTFEVFVGWIVTLLTTFAAILFARFIQWLFSKRA